MSCGQMSCGQMSCMKIPPKTAMKCPVVKIPPKSATKCPVVKIPTGKKSGCEMSVVKCPWWKFLRWKFLWRNILRYKFLRYKFLRWKGIRWKIPRSKVLRSNFLQPNLRDTSGSRNPNNPTFWQKDKKIWLEKFYSTLHKELLISLKGSEIRRGLLITLPNANLLFDLSSCLNSSPNFPSFRQ